MASLQIMHCDTSTDNLQAEEGSLPIGGSTVSQLQSQEQAGLLDAIDQLRRENIDAEIGIPQIVVCGDQSSGKSSLLEAIAQVPFPAGSRAVTMCKLEGHNQGIFADSWCCLNSCNRAGFAACTH